MGFFIPFSVRKQSRKVDLSKIYQKLVEDLLKYFEQTHPGWNCYSVTRKVLHRLLASYLIMLLIHLWGRVMALPNGEFVGIVLNHELKRSKGEPSKISLLKFC